MASPLNSTVLSSRYAKLGAAGFAFFFLKGMAWLGALAWGAWAMRG